MKIELESIGHVQAARLQPEDDFWGGGESCIILSDRFEAEALQGIESFSHVEVIFYFDQVDPSRIVCGARHPRNNPEWPAVGIFAQRGKNRPNQIGSTICRVVRRDGRRLYVAELDAIDGTPILDIKPVMSEFLPREQVRQPAWSHELMQSYWKPEPPGQPTDQEPFMYTLYYSPGTASMVVHLALLEIGAPYRLQLVDFDAGAQRDPEYLELNPQGVVPTLLIDGKPFVESAALLIMLADRHPEAQLAPPPGSADRNAWYQWIVYLSNSLAATYRFWFYPDDLGAPEHPPAVRKALQRKIEGVWDRLEAHLAANGPYLLGEKFSGADLLLTMLMRWSRKMPRPATEWPALNTLAGLVRARASWKKLYELEGLIEW